MLRRHPLYPLSYERDVDLNGIEPLTSHFSGGRSTD